MVFIGNCSHCGERANSITTIGYKNFSTCEEKHCNKSVHNMVVNYMIETDQYIMYRFYGGGYDVYNNDETGKKDDDPYEIYRDCIVIPRSNGSTSIGSLYKKESYNNFLIFNQDDNTPYLHLKFMSKRNIIMEKFVPYKSVAKYNLHLPMINIYTNTLELYDTTKKMFDKKCNEIYDFCVTHNKATMLIIHSCLYNVFHPESQEMNGMFGYFPLDILKIIIHHYFDQDEHIKQVELYNKNF